MRPACLATMVMVLGLMMNPVQGCLQAEGQQGQQAVWTAMTEGTSAVLDPGMQATVQQCLEVLPPSLPSA